MKIFPTLLMSIFLNGILITSLNSQPSLSLDAEQQCTKVGESCVGPNNCNGKCRRPPGATWVCVCSPSENITQ